MPVEYDPAKHETLVVKWYLSELRAAPDELDKMFHSSLRTLTDILWWAANKVKLAFEFDDQGISMACWLSPYMSGAEVGVWIRKDKRTAYQSVVFVNRFYKAALQHFPVLIGITQRPELHKVHLALGYQFAHEIPALFDGSPARVYFMTEETRRARHGVERENKYAAKHERIHAPTLEFVPIGEADPDDTGSPDGGGIEDGGRQFPDPPNQRKRRKRPRSDGNAHQEPAPAVSAKRAGE